MTEKLVWCVLSTMTIGSLFAAPASAPEAEIGSFTYNGKTYPLYPETLDSLPDIPSSCTGDDGTEIIVGVTADDRYVIVPVTVENGDSLNYKRRQWGKGRQLDIDTADFPSLALTGLHDEIELLQTQTITGSSISDITAAGRPGRYSEAGFMAEDEDIISVLIGDNRIVRGLGLTHTLCARPLFHVWNMILHCAETAGAHRGVTAGIDRILYNGKTVSVTWHGSKGWQESIFGDEILGMYQIEVWRELDRTEIDYLKKRYADLDHERMTALIKALSYIHTGEMAAYYAMRYGFYEGHTSYRADPIAIVLIFGLRSVEEISAAFEDGLYDVLTGHFTAETTAPVRSP